MALKQLIENANALGRQNLNAKGITTDGTETTYQIMGKIAEIQGGGNDTRLKEFVEGTLTELVDDTITSVGSYRFYYSTVQKIDLPNCTSVANNGFISATKLTSANLPNCETIGQYAFNGCSALASVNLPQCTTLGNEAFKSCAKLKSIVLPNCTIVGESAFNGCTILERIDFGSATTIKKQAFYNCKALTTLIIRTNQVASVTATSLLYSTPIASGTGFIYVPDDLVDDYKVATGWSNWANQIKGLSELAE